jgi:5-oxoprolinase (ATP-hydrolysing)
MPLDYDVVREKFEALTESINAENGSSLTPAEVACGFVNVANSAMARPIRALTEQRGYRTSSHNLSCFGGAGGQHATALATLLGMHNVIVHKYSSILSAYGMALADIAVDVSDPHVQTFSANVMPTIETRFASLRKRALEQLVVQGVAPESVVYESYLSLRYQGSDTTLMIARPADDAFDKAFIQEHKREFAFVLDAPIMIAGVRVRATSKSTSDKLHEKSPYMEELQLFRSSTLPPSKPQSFATNPVYFEELGKFSDVPLYRLHDLVPGNKIQGPAIILDNTQTILLHPQNVATILRSHVLQVHPLGVKERS